MRPETFTRAASFAPASWDPETLTVDAVLSTGARVSRGGFDEALTLAAINPRDLVGITVFSDHIESTRTAIGIITAARLEGDALVGTIKLSAAPEVESVRQKVAEGVIRGVSIGYTVSRWADSVDARTGRRIRTAAEWRIHEVSLVGRPADPPCIIRSNHMETPETPTPAPATPTAAEIAELVRSTVAEALAAAQTAAPEPARPIIRAAVGPSFDDPATLTRDMGEALAADAAGVPVTNESARRFRGAGLRGIARACAGVGSFTRDAEAIEAAFTRSGPAHSTGDFPAALLGAGARIAAHSYQAAQSPIMQLAVARSASDFRPVSEIGLGGFADLKPVSENGEIVGTTTAEESESWKLGTWAARFDVSRKMLLNDDLGLFGRVPAELGAAAARTEASAMVAMLTSNAGAGPTMGDSIRLFSLSHGNLADGGDLDALDAGDLLLGTGLIKMQQQTGIAGEILGIRASFLVVAPEYELAARKLLAAVTPTQASNANPLADLGLTLIVEPRLSGGAWYLFAHPAVAPVLALAHLAGQAGPVVQQQERWNGLGTSFRVFTDFAVAAVGWRGAIHNPGAE